MKKCVLFILAIVITLSVCGCSSANQMIGTRFGRAYFNPTQQTPEILCTYRNGMETKEIKIEDASFLDQLIAAIDGKRAGDDICDCLGDFRVVIDNQYTFLLHTDRIVIYCNTNEFDSFTVNCSEEEMQELYDLIEITMSD